MKQPEHYDLKKWLCNNCIIGLKIKFYQTGTDTSETKWELIPAEGKSKSYYPHIIEPLIELDPDWIRVMQVRGSVINEVKEYEDFCKREEKDLREFKRLKEKFK